MIMMRAVREIVVTRVEKLGEAETLLDDLTRVENESGTLPCLLAACREKKGDLEGALKAYGEAILREDISGSGEQDVFSPKTVPSDVSHRVTVDIARFQHDPPRAPPAPPLGGIGP